MIFIYIYIVIIINILIFITLIISSYYHKFHPIILRLILIFYSLFVVLKINLEMNNYWYSYVLFLLIIGGVIILILYLTRVSNNELFRINLLYYVYFFLKGFLLIFILFYILKFFTININMYEDIYLINKLIFLDVIINIKEIYVNFYISIYMLIYLFVLIVVCVLICLKNIIPLRQILKYEKFIKW